MFAKRDLIFFMVWLVWLWCKINAFGLDKKIIPDLIP